MTMPTEGLLAMGTEIERYPTLRQGKKKTERLEIWRLKMPTTELTVILVTTRTPIRRPIKNSMQKLRMERSSSSS